MINKIVFVLKLCNAKISRSNRKDPLLFNISNLKDQTVVKPQNEFYFNSDQQSFNHLKKPSIDLDR